MDQVTEQRLDQPVDSREVLVIDQRQGGQTPAPTQLLTSQHLGQTLATSIGDSDSQRNIGENSKDKAWRDKKRKNDQNYRHREKDKKKALEDENDRLKQEIQEKDNQMQLMKSKLEVVEGLEAENVRLRCELEERKQITKSLLDVIWVVKQQQMSPTNMEPLLAQIKLVADAFVSKVAELQQNITQPPGTHVYTQPWQPQHNISINQGSPAAATTLPLPPPLLPISPPSLTQPAGTSRVQQTFQPPGTFTEDSHGLPDFSLEEQLGQTAPTIDVSSEFSFHQGQGGNTAVESQQFTQGLSNQDVELDEFFSFFYLPDSMLLFLGAGGIAQQKEREHALVRNHLGSTGQTILSPFTKEYRVIAASLVAENDPLKPEIQEKQELCQEDQQMKSNIEAFEAENVRLKREIKEKGRRLKVNLRAFLVDYMIFRNQIDDQKLVTKSFGCKIRRLKGQIEEKERLMKSNMEAFDAENGRLKLEIGEKEQPNLEAFEAKNERLKYEIEETKQLMKSNLEAFEAQNGRLEHEIQAKEQLVKSNLETLEAQIRQLVDEFESLNVANVSVDLSMQTQSEELAHLEINFDKFKLN